MIASIQNFTFLVAQNGKVITDFESEVVFHIIQKIKSVSRCVIVKDDHHIKFRSTEFSYAIAQRFTGFAICTI
jgi:hypothetical protein